MVKEVMMKVPEIPMTNTVKQLVFSNGSIMCGVASKLVTSHSSCFLWDWREVKMLQRTVYGYLPRNKRRILLVPLKKHYRIQNSTGENGQVMGRNQACQGAKRKKEAAFSRELTDIQMSEHLQSIELMN